MGGWIAIEWGGKGRGGNGRAVVVSLLKVLAVILYDYSCPV